MFTLKPVLTGIASVSFGWSLTAGRMPNSRYVPFSAPPSACASDSSKARITFGDKGNALALSSMPSTPASSWTVEKLSAGLVYDVNNTPGFSLPAVNVIEP